MTSQSDHTTFLRLACQLAEEAVANAWGGPFGAVIVGDGVVVSRGQNRVLLTGDPTAHAEIEAIRAAVRALNPSAPTISVSERSAGTLQLVARSDDSDDPSPQRSRMLQGLTLYASGAPCPMCLSAIYWARIDEVYFANDWETARLAGFDDAHQYADFARPLEARRVPLSHLPVPQATDAFSHWASSPQRHPY